jgi:hypothetical protein
MLYQNCIHIVSSLVSEAIHSVEADPFFVHDHYPECNKQSTTQECRREKRAAISIAVTRRK